MKSGSWVPLSTMLPWEGLGNHHLELDSCWSKPPSQSSHQKGCVTCPGALCGQRSSAGRHIWSRASDRTHSRHMAHTRAAFRSPLAAAWKTQLSSHSHPETIAQALNQKKGSLCSHEKKARSQNQAQNQRCDHKVLDGLRENNHEDRNRSNGLVWKWVQAGTRFLSLRVILYVFIFCESAQNRLTFTNTQTPENFKIGRVYEHKHLWTEGSWLPDS